MGQKRNKQNKEIIIKDTTIVNQAKYGSAYTFISGKELSSTNVGPSQKIYAGALVRDVKQNSKAAGKITAVCVCYNSSITLQVQIGLGGDPNNGLRGTGTSEFIITQDLNSFPINKTTKVEFPYLFQNTYSNNSIIFTIYGYNNIAASGKNLISLVFLEEEV
jgi:hypothetical protein